MFIIVGFNVRNWSICDW